MDQQKIFDESIPPTIQGYLRRYQEAKKMLNAFDEKHWPFRTPRDEIISIAKMLLTYIKLSGHQHTTDGSTDRNIAA